MPYYAKDDQIAKTEIDGGIEITAQQYADALEAKMTGRETLVLNGELVIRDRAPSPGHTWEDGEWVAPPPPAPQSAESNGSALTERKRHDRKEAIETLLRDQNTPEAEALRNILELIQ